MQLLLKLVFHLHHFQARLDLLLHLLLNLCNDCAGLRSEMSFNLCAQLLLFFTENFFPLRDLKIERSVAGDTCQTAYLARDAILADESLVLGAQGLNASSPRAHLVRAQSGGEVTLRALVFVALQLLFSL